MLKEGRSLSGRERHCVFLNTGGTRFADISATSGLDFTDDGRAIASVDWDHDGDLDLWIANRTSPQLRFARNDTATAHHHLAVQLVGRTCNRDAIGARAELFLKSPTNPQAEKLIKTLRAGSGFLSQSSKWLHFGLGQSTEIERLVVRWPGDRAEVYTGLAADRRYRIVQGSGRAKPWEPRTQLVKLDVTTASGRPPNDASAVFLAARAPLPILEYKDLIGETITLKTQVSGPTLVNLWASWCLPCLGELTEMTARAKQLREAGLRLIALSVDGLDMEKATGPADARAFLAKVKFPFAAGFADQVLLSKLQLLINRMFYRHVPHVVPISFLIDAEYHLAAVYRGPVSIDRLLKDIRNLQRPPNARRTMATPFAGRWLARPPSLGLQSIAQAFTDRNWHDDAAMYLRRAASLLPNNASVRTKLGLCLQRQGKPDEALELYRQAVHLDPNDASAHNNLGYALLVQAERDRDRNPFEQAISHFRSAIQINSDHAEAHFNLAITLRMQGKLTEAVSHYRQVLQVDPNHVEAHNNLGIALRSQGKVGEAIRHYRLALQIKADHAKAHNNLANALQSQDKLEEAIEHYHHALRVKPDYATAHNNLAAALWATGRTAEALEHWRQAVQLAPDYLSALNSLSRVLASHPDAKWHNPQQAIQHAQRAVALTRHRHPAFLDTLAAAYATAGQFDQAVATAQRALDLAHNAGALPFADQIRQKLQLYRQRKPYHSPLQEESANRPR